MKNSPSLKRSPSQLLKNRWWIGSREDSPKVVDEKPDNLRTVLYPLVIIILNLLDRIFPLPSGGIGMKEFGILVPMSDPSNSGSLMTIDFLFC